MPTLGNATGTETDTLSVDQVTTCGSVANTPWTMVEAGTLTKMTIKLAGPSSGTQKIRAVIYNDSSNVPATYFSVSSEIVVAQGAAAAEVDFTGFDNTVLTNGQKMWLGFWGGPESAAQPVTLYKQTLGFGTMQYQAETYSSSGAPPTLSGPSPFTYQYWAYITYALPIPAIRPALEPDYVMRMGTDPVQYQLTGARPVGRHPKSLMRR